MRVPWCVEVPGSVSRPQHVVFPWLSFQSRDAVSFSLILFAAPVSSVALFILISHRYVLSHDAASFSMLLCFAMSYTMMPCLVP